MIKMPIETFKIIENPLDFKNGQNILKSLQNNLK